MVPHQALGSIDKPLCIIVCRTALETIHTWKQAGSDLSEAG
jgi:hypothetical protein